MEHGLRLLVKLPALLSAAGLSAAQLTALCSTTAQLIRFIAQAEAELFASAAYEFADKLYLTQLTPSQCRDTHSAHADGADEPGQPQHGQRSATEDGQPPAAERRRASVGQEEEMKEEGGKEEGEQLASGGPDRRARPAALPQRARHRR